MFKLNEPTDVSTHVLWKKLVAYLNENIHLLGGGAGGTSFYIKDVETRYTEDPMMSVIRRVRVINGSLDTTQIVPYEDALVMNEGIIEISDVNGLQLILDDIMSRLDTIEVPETHTHSNMSVLDELSDNNGILQYKGMSIVGGSGSDITFRDVVDGESFELSTGTVTPPPNTAPTFSVQPINVSGVQNANITISYTATDNVGITTHEFSDDNGTTWSTITPTQNGNVYTFTRSYSTATTKTCRVRVGDVAGLKTTSSSFTITVTAATVAVTGVTLNKSTTTVNTGSTDTLTATVAPVDATNKVVTWTTSNASIATVSNGVVTGVANGTVTITATTQDGNFTATCSVTVQTAVIGVTGVTVAPTTFTLTSVGATQQLTPTIAPSNATNKNVTYSSSDTNIATVSASGLVTAVANGSATITVTTADGEFTATCSTTVSVSASPIAPNAKMWLDGRDGSGNQTTWVDRMGNFNATIKAAFDASSGWTGTGIRFSKTIQNYFISDEITGMPTTGVHTLELYLKIHSYRSVWEPLFHCGLTNSRYGCEISTQFRFMPSTGTSWKPLTDITVDSYVCLQIVSNGVDIKVYKNNELWITLNKNTSNATRLNRIFASCFTNSEDGQIDATYYSVRLYDRVLTPSELTQNYQYETSVVRT